MKTCTKCGEIKPFSGYYKHKGCKDGYNTQCKICIKENSKGYYEHAKVHGSRKRVPRHTEYPEGFHKCSACSELKNGDLFYKDRNTHSGLSSYCKECKNKSLKVRRQMLGVEGLTTRRKWAKANRGRLREQDRVYKENNRDRVRITEAKRRARKKSLPDTLTLEEVDSILHYFEGKCALCDEPAEDLDHFVPLATEEVGTTKENIIPLCQRMNTSKLARNPFERSENYLTKRQQLKFKGVVKYLAELNGLTVEEYREFVFSCFKTSNKKENKEEID